MQALDQEITQNNKTQPYKYNLMDLCYRFFNWWLHSYLPVHNPSQFVCNLRSWWEWVHVQNVLWWSCQFPCRQSPWGNFCEHQSHKQNSTRLHPILLVTYVAFWTCVRDWSSHGHPLHSDDNWSLLTLDFLLIISAHVMVLVTVGPEPIKTIFSSSLFCEKKGKSTEQFSSSFTHD